MPAQKRSMPKSSIKAKTQKVTTSLVPQADLFDRVVAILEAARSNVVRAVNSNMVIAYWLIGREIVQEIQGGGRRAAYGKQVLEGLSRRLKTRLGPGYSETNLKYFRTFYTVYENRRPVGDDFPELPPGESAGRIRHPLGDELGKGGGPASISCPLGAELTSAAKSYPVGSESLSGFSSQLSWSIYRALMRVEKPDARAFYEREAIAGAWDKRTLERQIHSFYYERLQKSRNPDKMLADGRTLAAATHPGIETLKHPYVLEFLGLPEVAALQETDLERAILTHLQAFLLELGKGFAFVARQKRMRFEEQDRYVDLVFYHIQLKFYLLIDLKIGKLSHGDVGQMDGYVRMCDDLFVSEGDNPTIGLILCTEKDEVVARYSVLNDRKQIFASKYMLYLPTEEELRLEIERETRLLEDRAIS